VEPSQPVLGGQIQGEGWAWKTHDQWPPFTPQRAWDLLEKELKSRRIRFNNAQHILRWGQKGEGKFSVKEAYAMEAGHNSLEKYKIWK
jgi:hypothetical protein